MKISEQSMMHTHLGNNCLKAIGMFSQMTSRSGHLMRKQGLIQGGGGKGG